MAASALPGKLFAQDLSRAARLAIDLERTGPTIPLDFTGLSYETAQLANPGFFSSQNKSLIKLFRGLSPSGVLRLGGGSSEFTTDLSSHPCSAGEPSSNPPSQRCSLHLINSIKSLYSQD